MEDRLSEQVYEIRFSPCGSYLLVTLALEGFCLFHRRGTALVEVSVGYSQCMTDHFLPIQRDWTGLVWLPSEEAELTWVSDRAEGLMSLAPRPGKRPRESYFASVFERREFQVEGLDSGHLEASEVREVCERRGARFLLTLEACDLDSWHTAVLHAVGEAEDAIGAERDLMPAGEPRMLHFPGTESLLSGTSLFTRL